MSEHEVELIAHAQSIGMAAPWWRALARQLAEALQTRLGPEIGEGEIAVTLERLELGRKESPHPMSRIIEEQGADAIRQLLRERDAARTGTGVLERLNGQLSLRVKRLEEENLALRIREAMF